MFWNILTIILLIIYVVAVGLSEDEFGNFKWRLTKAHIGALGFVAVLFMFTLFTIVPANTVGVRYNPLNGGTQDGTLGEGFYFKSPLENIYELSTKVQEFKFENISIQTKDSQFVSSIIQIQARIDSTKANEYFSKYGDKNLEEIKSILSNTLQKEFEKITTEYNVMEILGEKRDEIVNRTLLGVQEELIKDGIMVERIVLVDTDAGEAVEKAIADEAVAKKAVETAEYEKQRVEIEGEAKVIEAQKQKEANDLLSITLTDALLTQQFIEKWSGELPLVMGESGNILDISGLIGE